MQGSPDPFFLLEAIRDLDGLLVGGEKGSTCWGPQSWPEKIDDLEVR